VNYISPEFIVNYKDGEYEVSCNIKTPLGERTVAANEFSSPLFFMNENQFYLWQKPDDVLLAEKFLPSGKMIVAAEEWNKTLQEFVLPLSKEYAVQFNNVQKEELRNVKPEIKLLLKEKGDYLLFQPVFSYKGYDIKSADKEKVILPVEDKLLVIYRNKELENIFLEKVGNLHSHFIRPENSDAFVLKGTDVLKNNWFFLFVDAMNELNVPVYGFDALKNFRFNTAKPSTKFLSAVIRIGLMQK